MAQHTTLVDAVQDHKHNAHHQKAAEHHKKLHHQQEKHAAHSLHQVDKDLNSYHNKSAEQVLGDKKNCKDHFEHEEALKNVNGILHVAGEKGKSNFVQTHNGHRD